MLITNNLICKWSLDTVWEWPTTQMKHCVNHLVLLLWFQHWDLSDSTSMRGYSPPPFDRLTHWDCLGSKYIGTEGWNCQAGGRVELCRWVKWIVLFEREVSWWRQRAFFFLAKTKKNSGPEHNSWNVSDRPCFEGRLLESCPSRADDLKIRIRFYCVVREKWLHKVGICSWRKFLHKCLGMYFI